MIGGISGGAPGDAGRYGNASMAALSAPLSVRQLETQRGVLIFSEAAAELGPVYSVI